MDTSLSEPAPVQEAAACGQGSAAEVFRIFLRLGLTSFGGPIAHLGYFREEFVRRRRWLDEQAYAELLALCQFLPGPASSQAGFALGLLRAGPWGALAAWVAFTLPSALFLFLCAHAAAALPADIAGPMVHALKLLAVAVVAQAVIGMARSLAPDLPRAGITVAAVLAVLLAGGALVQVAVLTAGGLAGYALCRMTVSPQTAQASLAIGRRLAIAALALFAILLLGFPLLAELTDWRALQMADAFYRSGSLVFGGGHAVLPLLEAGTVQRGWLSGEAFVAGYGAAQVVPGPLFSFAAYLGALIEPGAAGMPGALLGLAAIFLPGFLLLLGALPFWTALRSRPAARAALAGVNAAVVGVLGAALYDPVITSAIAGPYDAAIAVAALLLLVVCKVPVLPVAGGIVVVMAIAQWP